MIRIKIYCKTAEKLTSIGVTNDEVHEPLSSLFLTNDKNRYGQPIGLHARNLFSYKGYVDTRIEASFYST